MAGLRFVDDPRDMTQEEVVGVLSAVRGRVGVEGECGRVQLGAVRSGVVPGGARDGEVAVRERDTADAAGEEEVRREVGDLFSCEAGGVAEGAQVVLDVEGFHGDAQAAAEHEAAAAGQKGVA